MPNIAIFGGTFNPIHWGHLLIAETAIDQFQLDRIIWVPTFRSPHKANALLAFEHRLAMVQRAIDPHPAFVVSAIEGQRQGISYAITTLNTLQADEPNACWYWIIGNDAFQSLPRWYASEALMIQCTWIVAPRRTPHEDEQKPEEKQSTGGDPANEKRILTPCHSHPSPILSTPVSSTPSLQPRWHRLQVPLIDISSTLVRQRCQEGLSIRYLVPEPVRCYITAQKLYQMS
ncbi:MAG: nicotinate (nicotinamide) nucleotide adenylyltransferase [Leptolyngbya sp. BL-A-14]